MKRIKIPNPTIDQRKTKWIVFFKNPDHIIHAKIMACMYNLNIATQKDIIEQLCGDGSFYSNIYRYLLDLVSIGLLEKKQVFELTNSKKDLEILEYHKEKVSHIPAFLKPNHRKNVYYTPNENAKVIIDDVVKILGWKYE